MNPIKYFFLFLTYLWLRFDLILRLTFKDNWTPRYEFMASIFGEKDSEKFLKHRVKLSIARNKPPAPIISLRMVDQAINQFLKASTTTKSGRSKRNTILNQLLFWTLDPEINQQNVDSYRIRSTIVENLLNVIFQNALINETEIILKGIKKIVFSRVTYLGAKGEPSPVVHDTIMTGVGRILTSHFDEQVRIREQNLDKLTKVKLIKEIQKDKENVGSLAFSGPTQKDDVYQNRYPLPDQYSQILLDILKHYQYSAWPESRDRAKELIATMENNLGFKLEETFE